MVEIGSARRLGRRILALRLAAGGTTVAGLAAAPPASAQGVTDRDPGDAPGRGRGRPPSGATGSDPTDAPGRVAAVSDRLAGRTP